MAPLYLFDLLGVFVFAISGAIAGRQKGMDWFGMSMLALVTCIGGGTLRSLLIGATPPPVLMDPAYVIVAGVATLFAIIGEPVWEKLARAVSIFDAVGLGLFVCIGVQVSQANDLAGWACIGLGMVTATFGGVIRDLLRAEVPLIFRREIYATAALLGGAIYLGLDGLAVSQPINTAVTTFITAGIRILAIRRNWHLPGGQ